MNEERNMPCKCVTYQIAFSFSPRRRIELNKVVELLADFRRSATDEGTTDCRCNDEVAPSICKATLTNGEARQKSWLKSSPPNPDSTPRSHGGGCSLHGLPRNLPLPGAHPASPSRPRRHALPPRTRPVSALALLDATACLEAHGHGRSYEGAPPG